MSKEDPEPAATGESDSVFVALEDIALGDILEPQLLRLEQWPKDKVPEGALTKIEDVEGRRTRTKLYAGEPILDKKLYPKGDIGSSRSGAIPEGYRVIPVRVDSVTGAHGMILPGDRVDVSLYVAKSRVNYVGESGVYTILQDIKVFACNDVSELDAEDGGGSKSIKAQTISLLVTPLQAKKVILAGELGKVSLVMRSPFDSEAVPDVVVTAAHLLQRDSEKSEDRKLEVQDAPAPSGEEPGKSDFRKWLDRFRSGTALADNASPEAVSGAASIAAAPSGVRSEPRETWSMRIALGPEIRNVVLEAQPNESGSSVGRWRLSDASDMAGFDPARNVAELTPTDEQPSSGTDEQAPQQDEEEEKNQETGQPGQDDN